MTAPPSKSMAHRLLICAGLSRGESVIRRLAFSKDVEATIACLRALGASIRIDGDTATVRGIDAAQQLKKTAVLPCNECGSTLRFLIPLCLLSGEERVLTGSKTLLSRPLSVYETIADAQGLRFERASDRLTVQGRLSSGVYEIAGNISSQFISGLLFALPLLDGDSELRLIPPVESKPYIDMTLSALRDFGIEITEGELTLLIKGGQQYRPCEIAVEGDYSNALRWLDNYIESDDEQFAADAMVRVGDCYFFTKDYNIAITAYELKTGTYPDAEDLYPYYRAGVAAGLLGEPEEKIRLLSPVKSAVSPTCHVTQTGLCPGV